MAAVYQWGYYASLIVAGSVPYIIAEFFSWHISYLVMAAIMASEIGAALFAPREAQHQLRAIPTGDIPAAPLREGLEWLARFGILILGVLSVGIGLSGAAGGFSILEFALDAESPLIIAAFRITAIVLGLMLFVLAAKPFGHRRTRPGVYLSAAFGEPLKDFFRRYRGIAAVFASCCDGILGYRRALPGGKTTGRNIWRTSPMRTAFVFSLESSSACFCPTICPLLRGPSCLWCKAHPAADKDHSTLILLHAIAT